MGTGSHGKTRNVAANSLAVLLGMVLGIASAEVLCRLFDDTRPVYQVLDFPRGNANYELARPVVGTWCTNTCRARPWQG